VTELPYGQRAIETGALERWPNPHLERDYLVRIELPEFTCLCPRSGYPDFATIVVRYVPGDAIVELRSLKLYINGYRDRAISHEAAANAILDDLVGLLTPRWLEVSADFFPRGNVHTRIVAAHRQPGWTADVDLDRRLGAEVAAGSRP
jgi:7-cyano-7-deazaguanine reductase